MCGIFGIVNENPIPFNYGAFCTLGINNDSRGGDSCGVFIDGEVEYGVGKQKLFENFYNNSILLNSTDFASIALGHCRKASVGAVDLKSAQPVVIYDEQNNAKFVVLHNGTIHNYKELAEKYIPEIDITNMTDSQVMARIFYHKGYEVLGKYNGGAVFFIVDYRQECPEILLFKGGSRRYTYSVQETEERPLYFCIDQNNTMIFSSIDMYLPVFCRNCQVLTPTMNKLICFKDGNIFIKEHIDRSSCCQENLIVPDRVYTGLSQTINYLGYITYITFNNTYKLNGKLMHGQYYITNYGQVYERAPQHVETKQYWFFCGIPFDKKEYYCFVWKHFLKSKKNLEPFVEDNEKLIRYLSRDRIMFIDGVCYLVEGPSYLKLYDGEFQSLTSGRIRKFDNGIAGNERYQYQVTVIPPKKDINLVQLKKLWNL